MTNMTQSNNLVYSSKKRGKILTFWAPQVGSGCTFISFRVAKAIANQGFKVCMLDFDFRTPALTKNAELKDTLHYLDNLLPYAEVGNASNELFDSYLQKVDDNLYIIAGINNVSQGLDIQTKGLEYIVNRVADEYDYVIIDTNSYIDNAGTLVGLYMADKVYTLTEKNIETIHTFDYSKGIVQNANIVNYDKFILVINKVNPEVLLSASEIEKYFNKDESYSISNLGFDFVNDNNIGRGTDYLVYSKKATKFNEDISNLVKNTINVEFTNSTTKKKGLFGKRG